MLSSLHTCQILKSWEHHFKPRHFRNEAFSMSYIWRHNTSLFSICHVICDVTCVCCPCLLDNIRFLLTCLLSNRRNVKDTLLTLKIILLSLLFLSLNINDGCIWHIDLWLGFAWGLDHNLPLLAEIMIWNAHLYNF